MLHGFANDQENGSLVLYEDYVECEKEKDKYKLALENIIKYIKVTGKEANTSCPRHIAEEALGRKYDGS